jgi:hypothetical protein
MAKIVHSDTSADVTETFALDEDKAIVRRSQDVEPTIDAIARANLDGVREVPGLGRLIAEVPITVGIEFCEQRGIPWEKFMYGNQYDAEFKRFIADRQRFQYRQARRLHAVRP